MLSDIESLKLLIAVCFFTNLLAMVFLFGMLYLKD